MAKAGYKFRRRTFRIGGKPVIFDPGSEEAIAARLEETAERLQREMEERLRRVTATPPPGKRAYLKWQQEEILRRVRQKYPDGNIPRTAQVQRDISDKKFRPAYNTVHAALGRKPKK